MISDQIVDDFSTRYQVIETQDGLMISESRVSLYDVMELYKEGDSIYEISDTFNLTPLQVQTAIDYIEAHRATLELQLVKAIQLREEREQYYRTIQKEIWDKIAKEPMTPQRAAFYALRSRHLHELELESNAAHSQ